MTYYSSYYNYLDGVKLAIKNGADIHVYDEQLLFISIKNEFYYICDILINNGCELLKITSMININRYLEYLRINKLNERLY